MDKSELDTLVDLGEKELARIDMVQVDKKNQREIEYKLKIRAFLDDVKRIVPPVLNEYVQFGEFERQDALTRYNATAKIIITGFAPIVLLCYYNSYSNGDLALRGVDLLSYKVGKDFDAEFGSMYYVYEYATHVLLTLPPDPTLDPTFFYAVLALAKQKGDNKAEVEQEVAQKNQEDKDKLVAKIDDNTSLVYRTLPGAPDIIARLVDTMQEFVKWAVSKDDKS